MDDKIAMSVSAKKTRAKYFREYYHKNKDKYKIYQNDYWIKVSQKELAGMKPYNKMEDKHE
jgi:hypothetical protein